MTGRNSSGAFRLLGSMAASPQTSGGLSSMGAGAGFSGHIAPASEIVEWVSGGGYRSGDIVPCAFSSLINLAFYWDTQHTVNATMYELNGVSPAIAVCVLVYGASSWNSTIAILYMAPSSASSCWFYLQHYLGALYMGVKTGAGANKVWKNSNASGTPITYVAISKTGPGGNIIWNGVNPVMSKLTVPTAIG